MSYTFGRTTAYNEHIRTSQDPRKLGKQDGYPGGAAWRTRAEAQQYINRLPDKFCPDWHARDFSVYGIEADWDHDTYQHDAAEPWRLLKRDARLVRL